MGKLSITPIGTYTQPLTLPKGKSASFFRFDPKIFNENSWLMLKDVLTKVGRSDDFKRDIGPWLKYPPFSFVLYCKNGVFTNSLIEFV
jgi:hypothetical protein